MRRQWLALSDDELLADCEVDRFRASGPGGQKRNKTESAVRLRHPPSGVSARAVESRSQHENRQTALARLRLALAVQVRMPSALSESGLAEVRALAATTPGPSARRDVAYLQALGDLLDLLTELEMNLRATAERLEVNTAALARALKSDPEIRRWVNRERSRLDLGPLR